MSPKHETPIIFPEAEWAFYKVPPRELRCCAWWELNRLGGRKRKPWLKLSEAAKQRLLRLAGGQRYFLEAALRESFRYWRKSSDHEAQRINTTIRSNATLRRLLVSLVVMRAYEAGLTRKEAREKTAVLGQQWKCGRGYLSPTHWRQALRNAKALRQAWERLAKTLIGDPPYDGVKARYSLLVLDDLLTLAKG